MCRIAFVILFRNIKGTERAPRKSKPAALGTMGITHAEQDPSPGPPALELVPSPPLQQRTKRASGCMPRTESHFILDSLPLFNLKYSSLKNNNAQGISSFNLAWRSLTALREERQEQLRVRCALDTSSLPSVDTAHLSKPLDDAGLRPQEKG